MGLKITITSVADLNNYLTRCRQAVEASIGVLANIDCAHARRIGERLRGFLQRTHGFTEGVGRVNNVLQFVQAIDQIASAARILNGDMAANLRNNPERVAWAYGQLFTGLGNLLSHAPPPANAYADFLIGAESFFLDMSRQLHPSRRPNGWQMRLTHGRYDHRRGVQTTPGPV